MYTRFFMHPRIGTGKFFYSNLPHHRNIRLGRMAPETTVDVVEQEFKNELQEIGLVKLRETLEEEYKVLQDLQSKQTECLNKIAKICVTPVQKQIIQGKNIHGSFWNNMQKEMNQIETKDQLQIREEMIDWLKTRQTLYSAMQKHHQSPNMKW